MFTDGCELCNSIRKIPKEFLEQTSSSLPTGPGQLFSADVVRRKLQKIFLARGGFSSFTTGTLIPDEIANSLRSGLMSTTSFLRQPSCSVKVDGATGFLSLKDDPILKEQGISLEFGRVKNPNKNPIIDKGIQEFEKELLVAGYEDKELTSASLDTCLRLLNSRIRHTGLSAKEMVTRRDQITGEILHADDVDLANAQKSLRDKNHEFSSKSKARGGKPPANACIDVGDLVYIKNEGDKFHSRPRYIVTSRSADLCTLKKMANGKIMAKPIEVPIQDLFKVSGHPSTHGTGRSQQRIDTDSSEDDSMRHSAPTNESVLPPVAREYQHPDESTDEENENTGEIEPEHQQTFSGRPKRSCGPPRRLIDEWTENR